jgi:hypothetical protein
LTVPRHAFTLPEIGYSKAEYLFLEDSGTRWRRSQVATAFARRSMLALLLLLTTGVGSFSGSVGPALAQGATFECPDPVAAAASRGDRGDTGSG